MIIPPFLRRILVIYILIFLSISKIYSQKLSLSAGTDIPYQHYAGLTFHYKSFGVSYRTGFLLPPYSNILMSALGNTKTDPDYIRIIETSFQKGWMNTFNTFFYFGKNKTWYIGPEVRHDLMSASNTPDFLIETLFDLDLGLLSFFGPFASDIEFGVKLWAAGFRVGKKITLGKGNHNFINIELSASKYFDTTPVLIFNGREINTFDGHIRNLLWEKVFKKYGYIGGVGLSYCYQF